MNIINFLKTNNNSRKIFGKRELKIIEKQLLGINLTQSEKNRLSRDIRVKFTFIQEISKFSDMFHLKKSAIIKEVILDTIELIKEDKDFKKINEIILYGSAVENKLNFRSDIDIAVKLNKTNSTESTLFRKRILGKTNQRIDLQIYNDLPEKIKRSIDKKGRTIWSRD